jgi:hypothetical protein
MSEKEQENIPNEETKNENEQPTGQDEGGKRNP